MAKVKPARGPKGLPNRHLHARISYLYQAVNYLSTATESKTHGNSAVSVAEKQAHTEQEEDGVAQQKKESNADSMETDSDNAKSRADVKQKILTDSAGGTLRLKPALYLAPHIRSVSLKSQIRLSRDIKRSLCKRCNMLLVPGKTSTEKIENLSYEGQKLWADVLVVECKTCGAGKRFPVGAKRQLRKAPREAPTAIEPEDGKGKVAI